MGTQNLEEIYIEYSKQVYKYLFPTYIYSSTGGFYYKKREY